MTHEMKRSTVCSTPTSAMSLLSGHDDMGTPLKMSVVAAATTKSDATDATDAIAATTTTSPWVAREAAMRSLLSAGVSAEPRASTTTTRSGLTTSVAVTAFYNWMKQRLYGMYLHVNEYLVDIGSGRGEGSRVYAQNPSKILNIDCDSRAIEHGRREMKERGVECFHWQVCDLTRHDAFVSLIEKKVLHVAASVNVFSSNLSLQYFCKSQEALDGVLAWIATFLVDGGYFIGVIHDAERVMMSCVEGECMIHDSITSSTGPEFGHAYSLSPRVSEDDDDDGAYLVFWSLLVSRAKTAGLRLINTEMFADAYKSYPHSNLTRAEMRQCFLCRTFVFQRTLLPQ